MARASRPGISRRKLLIGGGVGVGLVLGWALWPRSYGHNLVAADGEHVLNAFLKIGEDGQVTVIVPQAEMGQGVWTTLPQILADELGADWRTVGVEPAPINPLYANDPLVAEWVGGALPPFLGEAGEWAAREVAVREAIMITAGSSSIRGFERRFREAGAAARMLLCQAAADRWEVNRRDCRTGGGFVRHGERSARFGELVAAAAELELSDRIELRAPGARTISGWSAPRLDLPSKVDGSARFAADVRLPDMIFASSRKAPSPRHRLGSVNRAAADDVFGVMAIFENPDFVACAATNWWAADQGVKALDPRWESDGPEPDDRRMEAALEAALESGEGRRFVDRGDVGAAFAAGGVIGANYWVGLAAHAQLEPLVATARVEGDRLEIWAPTQAPGLMRSAAARATGYGESRVIIYPMLVGGGFGRNLEVDAAVQAAIVAIRMNRPVQLSWSREEETMRDRFRPPARARMLAKLATDGRIQAWHARIATPSVRAQYLGRLMPAIPGLGGDDDPEDAAVAGAAPAYVIPDLAVDHLPVDVGVECGVWRSMAHSYTAFFTECFVDELASRTARDPLAFRIAMLGDQPRLARCLTTAATLAGWRDDGAQGGMGIAAHSCFGSHVAIMAQVRIDDGRAIVVDRIWAAVDCGRVINPEIVRQQIEGGLIFGLSAALGGGIGFRDGRPRITNYDGLALPLLADTPRITVELIGGGDEPGGVSGIAVPPVAPAIGNAIFAATGRRLRRLPFVFEQATDRPNRRIRVEAPAGDTA